MIRNSEGSRPPESGGRSLQSALRWAGTSGPATSVPAMNPTGPLIPADETFCHQIPQTFAIVGSSDPSWTEQVCAMAAAVDGSLQLGFGLGKYTNRNVMDGYAAVSRGVEQTTVRASRASSSANCCLSPRKLPTGSA